MTTRSALTGRLWWGLWLLWVGYVIQIIVDGLAFNAPVQLLALQVLPLVVFMPGVARDKLRSLIWLCFILMAYFVQSVLSVFAQPERPTTWLGLVCVVCLFAVATAYIRFRGRELGGGVTGTDSD